MLALCDFSMFLQLYSLQRLTFIFGLSLRKRTRTRDDDVDDDLAMDAEGRLVIKEEEEKKDAEEDEAAEDIFADKKRKRGGFHNEGSTEGKGPGGKRRRRNDDKDVSKKGKRMSGQEYKAKKGTGGDVQKGALQPFAYLPLDHRFLNRKKKREAPRQYANLVNAGRSGKKNNRNNLKY